MDGTALAEAHRPVPGYRPEPGHSEVDVLESRAAFGEALRAVAAAAKCPGVLALTPQDEARYAGWGARYFATVSTGIITKALKEAAQGGRAQLNY